MTTDTNSRYMRPGAHSSLPIDLRYNFQVGGVSPLERKLMGDSRARFDRALLSLSDRFTHLWPWGGSGERAVCSPACYLIAKQVTLSAEFE